MRKRRFIIFFIMSLFISACSGNGQSGVITALPSLTALPDGFKASATPESTQTRLEMTIEAQNNFSVTQSTLDSDLKNNDVQVDFDFISTPVIETAGLESGVAREIAMATDTAMIPKIDEPLIFEMNPVPILFNEFYDGYNMRTGLIISDKLKSLDGQQVVMEGYVAPPLKPRLDFFVLTRIQLATCPFCSNSTDWPDDIALIYMPEPDTINSDLPVRVFGRMEIGTSVDAETGMVSLVRIYAENIEQIR